MINCPNCDELLGNNVRTCFNCGYDFGLRRVPSQQEREDYMKSKKELQKIQEEERQRVKQQMEEIHARKLEVLSKNAYYEYRTEYLCDDASGMLPKSDLDYVLGRYAADGWRLHTMVVNEAGKSETTMGIGGISSSVNATMDVTILVFERCVKASEF